MLPAEARSDRAREGFVRLAPRRDVGRMGKTEALPTDRAAGRPAAEGLDRRAIGQGHVLRVGLLVDYGVNSAPNPPYI